MGTPRTLGMEEILTETQFCQNEKFICDSVLNNIADKTILKSAQLDTCRISAKLAHDVLHHFANLTIFHCSINSPDCILW